MTEHQRQAAITGEAAARLAVETVEGWGGGIAPSVPELVSRLQERGLSRARALQAIEDASEARRIGFATTHLAGDWRIEVRPTPNSCISSRSEGSRSPGRSLPAVISRSMRSATSA